MKTKATIQRKLMTIVLLTTGVVLFVTCMTFLGYQFFSFRETTKNQLATVGEIIAANSTAALAFEDENSALEILQSLKAEKNVVAACLYDTTGRVVAKYFTTEMPGNLPTHPGGEGYEYVGTYLQGFQKVTQGNLWVGTLYLQSDLNAFYGRLMRYSVIALFLFAVSILIAFILSRKLQKSVSAPILSLSKTAETVSREQDYSVRANKFDDDELGHLTDVFNNMLQHIEQQNVQITAFSSDLEEKVKQRTIELQHAYRELKLKTEFTEVVIDSSVAVIAVFDLNLNFVLLNDYARRMYRVSSEHVLGKNILTVFPDVEHTKMYCDLKSALAGRFIHDPYYASNITSSVLENFYIPLLDASDQVYSVLVLGHDITAIVESNEKLKNLNISLEHTNTKLENTNRDLEQFAYIVSHDLQEPLRKIQIFSGRLESELSNMDASNYLSKITSSASRMSELIKGILNYSRLTHTSEDFGRTSLRKLLENIKNDFELSISEKKAQVTVDELPDVIGSRLQLNQLFSNLLSNSLKFSNRAPNIHIYASKIRKADMSKIVESAASDYTLIHFDDNGIGFSQEYADSIFAVFQRLHNKNDYPGTGIGLAICKRIVDQHNGHISVSSVVGEGTKFSIYLPLAS